GSRTLRFTDVTAGSGIDARGYGMGVATGDFDNDGCVDLYVTNLGPNQLFRNNCDGTFTDVTKKSGTAGAGWSVSAAFVDVDRDGRLDLFVGHYLNYSIAGNIRCYGMAGGAGYCPPHVYTAQPSHLYHNEGDGTFTDVTAAAGIAAEFGPTLGVATADFNGDGWMDIYVANDGQPNQLWINQRNGTFKNTALLAGAALGANGDAKSSMGVDAGDFDNDGDLDVFIVQGQMLGKKTLADALFPPRDPSSLRGRLFRNDLEIHADGSRTLRFTDVTAGSGIDARGYGMGVATGDFDNDGCVDLYVTNLGPNQLFRNNCDGTFTDVTKKSGTLACGSSAGRRPEIWSARA
ncbi:MAG: hypothetical protein DMD48_14970, partial [Gemmatimonadetes bacterium]